MFEGNGENLYRTVFHHQRMFAGIDRAEAHLEGQGFAKQIQHGTQIVPHLCRPVHKQIPVSPQHAERGNQTGQTETVVAVQMGDKDMIQPAELHPHVTHLQLGSLAAVYHIQFVAQVDNLGRREMAGGRQSRAAT
ncbi:hypothetical protein Barb6_02089 [Bacteroidales bacterium Barb6]|nr:hypothetical protein Barb6_02089 [Bacteroidales bacterium Barb6]